MKSLLLLFGMFSVLHQSSCGGGKADFSSPEKTFETLVAAIQSKDIAAYEKCWIPERMEREGMVTQLKENPGRWEELNGLFKGPLKLEEGSYKEREGKEMYRTSVEAPEAEQGGIGSITMQKVDGKWKMWSW